jgi:hypothetical protein
MRHQMLEIAWTYRKTAWMMSVPGFDSKFEVIAVALYQHHCSVLVSANLK